MLEEFSRIVVYPQNDTGARKPHTEHYTTACSLAILLSVYMKNHTNHEHHFSHVQIYISSKGRWHFVPPKQTNNRFRLTFLFPEEISIKISTIACCQSGYGIFKVNSLHCVVEFDSVQLTWDESNGFVITSIVSRWILHRVIFIVQIDCCYPRPYVSIFPVINCMDSKNCSIRYDNKDYF